jgi:hypothetical protein
MKVGSGKFALDSSLEGSGFGSPPDRSRFLFRRDVLKVGVVSGTSGSNPLSSSGESAANLIFGGEPAGRAVARGFRVLPDMLMIAVL